MIVVERFYDPKLAQASYLIGSTETHTAVVIDANRDAEQYVRAAADEGLTITHVTETHIHADFVSGSRELAARTGARLYLSDEGGDDWKYAFAAASNAVLLKDGDAFSVGSVRIEARHTPGHTPEHLMFLVTDTSAANEPLAAVTGDFLFVGDVGRPDLLERAAHVAGTMDGAARSLYHSLKHLQPYADHLQIWPGHGAGSACGKGLGSLPQSTLGYERRTNWALAPMGEDEFVRRVLEGQPDPPRYFGEMKRVNKAGPRVLGQIALPAPLTVDQLSGLVAANALVIDIRPAADYAAAHIPGTVNIPLNKSFTTWAGWLVPYTADVFLLTGDRRTEAVHEALRDLAMIGLDRVAGYADVAAALAEWKGKGYAVGTIAQIDSRTVAEKLQARAADVVDVRSRGEWDSGRIPGATHIPLGELLDRSSVLSKARPIVVHCQGGGRSAIAASLLRARGFTQVMNMAGGFSEWEASGQPVERERAEATAARG
ncbi:MAG TPA: rhodanese-like domain-containing protein [Vicinamibacterales bacterium]|nr:rhodanese-like domain-containing protein [Vicinamibacterales bacterium]